MIPNRKLIIPYTAPYFAYVLIASVFTNTISIEYNYLIRLVAISAILLWAKKWYFTVIGPKSPYHSILVGMIAGLFGLIIWVSLLSPFVSVDKQHPWSFNAFILKLICAGFLVPVFEEFFIRGFLFRLILQWDFVRKKGAKDSVQTVLDDMSINDVEPGAWSWMAVILSTILFASGHQSQEWLAAIVYGLLMAFLLIIRKDILSCIVAHSVTNISLALYVFTTGKWHLW